MDSNTLDKYDGEKVYKYYSYNDCMLKMFAPFLAKTLRYKKYTSFNDPYDCYIASDFNGNIQSIRKCEMETVFVCSMTNKKDDILMWSHYASSHTGFVIEYDVKELLKNLYSLHDAEKFLFCVKYDADIKLRTLLNLDAKNSRDEILKAIISKYECWKYENEVRSVFYDMRDDDFIDISITEKCISAIILGCNFIKQRNGRIPKFLQSLNNDKKLFYIKPCSDKYELKLESGLENKWFMDDTSPCQYKCEFFNNSNA